MADYIPPKVWDPETASGGKFASINRPTAGVREQRDLPRGEHPFQLYSLATPNGVKAALMLEELIEAGHLADYDAWLIDISSGDQFTSGFTAINPNQKIPALLDLTGEQPVRVFESGAILLHLAEKYDAFLGATRAEMLSWLFWQVGTGPFIGGGFGHFYHYAPEKIRYAIDRYAMETKRIFDVADRRLGETRYLAGEEYSIADIAVWPWLKALVDGEAYGEAHEFLQIGDYTNVARWSAEIGSRPAAKRAVMVNRTWGDEDGRVPERHSAADFEGKAL